MSIEEDLRGLILKNYKSIRAFTEFINTPYSTIDNIFKRGVSGTGISTISKICKALNIDPISLADGEIKPMIHLHDVKLTDYEQSHIEKYRTIDSYGKDMVDTILNKEYKRCTETSEPEMPKEKPILLTTAAYGGDGVEVTELTPEQLKKAEEEYWKIIRNLKK